jgi:hypothetical protein
MAKQQPPNTKGHTLFLPNELHQKLKLLASYGTVDNFIIQCIEDGLAPRWKEYVAEEYARLQEEEKNENRQRAVRRSSPPNAKKEPAKDRGDKSA